MVRLEQPRVPLETPQPSLVRLPRHPHETPEVEMETKDKPDGELRAFLVVLRRALLMVCGYIEQRYIETK